MRKYIFILLFAVSVLFCMRTNTVFAAIIPETELSHSIPSELSIERKAILKTALSLEGQIPYEWGGKPVNEGWNERWNSKNGLDCSGFIQWVYWTAIGKNDTLESTCTITSKYGSIPYEELQPGDLGLIRTGGSYYLDAKGNRFWTESEAANSSVDLGYTEKDVKISSNHVGIYYGKDEEGNDLWIHCNAKDNTVVIESVPYFHYYVHVSFDETYEPEPTQEPETVQDVQLSLKCLNFKPIEGLIVEPAVSPKTVKEPLIKVDKLNSIWNTNYFSECENACS